MLLSLPVSLAYIHIHIHQIMRPAIIFLKSSLPH